jgi:pyrimidine-specific ribonucleoside hydrolase
MRARPLLAAVAIAALVTSACAVPAATPQPSVVADRPLIVDVDMDSSDVLALGYLLTVPGYDVQAITIPATGIGSCPPGAEHARAIAVAVGRGDIPVACGDATPVGNGHPTPAGWRVPADDLYGITLAEARANETRPAALLIVEVLRANPGGVDIFVAGPLTNVALALIAQPELRERVRRVVAMVGAVAVPGNVDAEPAVGSPEFNAWADPGALAAVVASGVPILMVPLDATNDVPVTPAFYAQLESDHRAAGADIAYQLFARNRFLVLGGQFFWDPLAAAVLEDPSVVTTKQVGLRIGFDDPLELGRTLLDEGGVPVEVAVSGNEARFSSVFLAGLRRSPALPTPFAPEGPLTVAFDGTTCRVAGADGLRAGPYWVAATNDSASDLTVGLVTLHPGAKWEQLVAYAATYTGEQAAPTFADVSIVPVLGQGLDAVVDLPVGEAGFVCVTQADGAVTGVALGPSLQVGP